MPRIPSAPSLAKRHPLAASLGALCCVSASAVHATAFVTNCNNSGTGSLRAAVSAALSGETVNATALAGVCSTITLTTGAIATTKTNVKIIGPGKDSLTVTAAISATSRLFTHTGTGTLEIDDMSLGKGYVDSPGGVATGGCIDSRGSVVLKRTNVVFCVAHAASGFAYGGGVYASGSVYVLDSLISGNTADGDGGEASGGGIHARGGVTAKYSTISNNTATNFGSGRGPPQISTPLVVTVAGGGIYARGSGIFIHHSTISGNTAGIDAGGLRATVTGSATILDSTISNNRALHGVTGGAFIGANTVTLYNSTIAENTAYAGHVVDPAGIEVRSVGASPTMNMESTLIANNTYGTNATNSDFYSSGFTITGRNNLIRASSSSLPADTIVGKCPLLGPLKSNGGATQTHALLSRSPAIDAGNNTLGLAFDQRGAPYVRASGPPGTMSPKADIGAYEVNQLDVVFDASFEGCP